MKKTLIYATLGALFVFSMAALIAHFANIRNIEGRASREATFPFGYWNGQVNTVTPDAENAGIKVGDRIAAISGRDLGNSDMVIDEEMSKMRGGVPVTLTMQRRQNGVVVETYEATVLPVKVERDLQFYSRYVVGFMFTYTLPSVCILLAFWVLFVRHYDPLAWILLFVLLGLGSFPLEMYPSNTVVGAFQDVFFGTWALGMLLFGIYFPERLALDEKLPWLKWIFIVPLSLQVVFTLMGLIRAFTGVNLFVYIWPLATAYGYIGFFVNMIAIGLFFAALGYKSGTMKNPDARRRMKLLVYGTSAAITPTFLLIIYKTISGSREELFKILPFWISIAALLLLLLFPLSLAYVIVVERAMDVRVVVRQGIQYALAKGGVRVLQFLLLVGIGLGVRWTITNYGFDSSAQIGFIVGGIALIPLIEFIAKPIRLWIDRRFFREAYNAEQILSDLSEEVRTMVETKPLLETVSSKISESLHVPQVALLLKNGGSFEPAYAIGYDTQPVAKLGDDAKSIQTLKKNQHIVIYDEYRETTSTPTITLDERRQIEELNAQLLLPVAAKNQLSGIISLSAKRSEEPFSPNDLRLLKSVAAQTGLALENSRLTETIANEAALKERLNRELEIAREVQERLFPQELPSVDGIEYYGACRPALGVGGDYYDFIELDGGKFGIAIGDVSGKGIGASLMMASLQASLRGQAIHSKDDLAALMSHVNKLVYETSTTNRYATFFYAQYEPATKKLTYVNAGHNPPFLLRKNDVILLEEGGAVVGMLPPMLVNYTQGEIVLESGDLLVGFTDGISEAMNPREEEWGEDSLLEEMKKLDGIPPRAVLDRIVAAADKFADGAKQHDDMTMIVVRVS